MVTGGQSYKTGSHQDLGTVYVKKLECFSEKNSACWGHSAFQKEIIYCLLQTGTPIIDQQNYTSAFIQ